MQSGIPTWVLQGTWFAHTDVFRVERKTCSSLCEVMLVGRMEVSDGMCLEVHKVDNICIFESE